MFGGGSAYVLVIVWLKEGAWEGLSVRPFVSVGSHVRVRRGGGETVLAAVADAVAVGVLGTIADGVMGCVAEGGCDVETDGEAPVRGLDAVGVTASVAVGNGSDDAVCPTECDSEATGEAVYEAERDFAADDEPPVRGADTDEDRPSVPLDSEMVDVSACDDVLDTASDLVVICEGVGVPVAVLKNERLTDTAAEAE